MRHVEFGPLGRKVSAIGFGCASLGSRIDARRGTESLGRAYDAGVSWFDVAPSYGDGDAETILGKFLQGKRSDVVLCTKVGRLAGSAGFAARTLKPVAQRVLSIAPRLRSLAVRHHPPARRMELTGAFIGRSIEDSLSRLQTDHVDVLALHEPTLADIEREDVLRALDGVVNKGQARCIGVAGELEVALRAVELSDRIRVMQVADNYFTPNIEWARDRVRADKEIGFVTHSVYGARGALDQLTELVAQQPSQRAILASAGYHGTASEMAAAFLLDLAFARNPDGVTLLSMYEPKHLRANLERLDAGAPAQAVHELRARLSL